MYEQNFGVNSADIKVMGVGGGGCNAINSMIDLNITSAKFIAVNTDNQALLMSKAETCIQIGGKLTKGLGAGSDPTIGEAAAEESKDEIAEILKGTDLLFIAAGMGGGTGTGACSVIARIARELGILTVAVVTKPFSFEGRIRNENANKGIANLRKYVDTLVIIPNDKLLQFLPHQVGVLDAFKVADDMLRQGIIGIVELIATPSLINLDFADVNTVMRNQGLAHMGIGMAKGENRVLEAVRQAVSSPLLETTIEGARSVILNVTGGKDLMLSEVNDAAVLIQGIIDASANIIFGATIDDSFADEVKITVIATGFTNEAERKKESTPNQIKPAIGVTVNKADAMQRFKGLEEVRSNERTGYVGNSNNYVGNNGVGINTATNNPQMIKQQPQNEGMRQTTAPSVSTTMRSPVSNNSSNADNGGKDLPAFMKRLFGRK